MSLICRCRPAGVGWAALFCPEKLDLRTLRVLTRNLVELDEIFLDDHPETPDVYACGLRYVKEPDRGGVEWWWWTPDHVLRQGFTDCKALACWRVAELRTRYGDARATAVPVQMTDDLFHIAVLHGDGTLEDPSQMLGLRAVV